MTASPTPPWTAAALGDSALLLTYGDRIDLAINSAVNRLTRRIARERLDGIVDLVPAYATLAVHFDPSLWSADTLAARIATFADDETTDPQSDRIVTIPVAYGGENGPDLNDVAHHAGFTTDQVIDRHAAAEYRVMFLGFAPGFAYLAGLDPSLATPRRSTPRASVPAGSVGIGGAQTAVYPAASPGGWNLIGRTGRQLFDGTRRVPCLLQAGDRVRFEPVAHITIESKRDSRVRSASPSAFIVEHPGLLTSIQDLGRPGHQHLGVTPGGALDRVSHCIANWLVGNDERAATLEMTIVGATLFTLQPATIAVSGADLAMTIDDVAAPNNCAIAVPAGARIAIGQMKTGARAYLAVAGGFDVPLVLGSRSTAIRDHFGGLDGRSLRKGDELSVGSVAAPLVPRGIRPPTAPSHATSIRVLFGPHWSALPDDTRALFLDPFAFVVSSRSDRMGLRLEGPELTFPHPIECLSAGVASGTIQLPPDGQPIVLLGDRQTTGGYPRLGEVISADLPRLAQMRPGDRITFTMTTIAIARAALAAQSEWLRQTHRQLRG